jgi:hypothetical protein
MAGVKPARDPAELAAGIAHRVLHEEFRPTGVGPEGRGNRCFSHDGHDGTPGGGILPQGGANRQKRFFLCQAVGYRPAKGSTGISMSTLIDIARILLDWTSFLLTAYISP